jgi:hypothetical protein
VTSLKQLTAKRLNALNSCGPRTAQGIQQSRRNAWRHGLTAETVIAGLEDAGRYQAFETAIAFDYSPASAAERELVARLASVLWRLRRSTAIETALFETEAELTSPSRSGVPGTRTRPSPEWCGEADRAIASADGTVNLDRDAANALARCFQRVGPIRFGSFDLLNRYETALWRQAAQLLFMLQPARRRNDSTDPKAHQASIRSPKC